MIAFIRSAIFFLLFFLASIFYVSAALILNFLGWRVVGAIATGWARMHHILVRYVLGISIQIEGELPKGEVIVASKHQSMFETIELLVLLNKPAVVMKRELEKIPFWGRVAKNFGVIPVERTAGSKALREMLKAAKAAKALHRPILIFPEGTRVLPGETPPLRSGIAGLYKAVNMPIIPLALNTGTLWPKGKFAKHAGTVTFRFCPVIPIGLDREEVEIRVHQAINSLEAGYTKS